MQPRTTAVLLAVALALGAFVYFYEIRGAETRQAAEEQAKKLFPEVEAEDVSAIWLETQDGVQARLERRGGDWQIVEPIDFLADGTVAEGMASSLAGVASEGVIEEPQEPEVYGLGNEAKVVHFRAGEQEHALRLGKLSPVGGKTYASVGAEASVVYTVPTFRVNGFAKSLTELREHRLLDFDAASIRRIEASWPDGRVVLERSEEGWRLLEPLAARADEETVDGLLSDLRFLRASGFLDEPTPEATAALETAEFDVRLLGESGEEGDPPVYHLTLGAVSGEGRVARSSGADILYSVPSERLQDLPRRLVEYRYKDLTDFAILDAQKLELAFASAAGAAQEAVVIVAQRGEDGWSSTPEAIQPGKVARIVSELSRLEASDILAESMDDEALAVLGLSPPETIVRVFGSGDGGADEPLLAEIFLGRIDSERGIFARVPDRDTVYALDVTLAEHVPVSLEAFRNRFVSEEQEAEVDPEPEEAAEP